MRPHYLVSINLINILLEPIFVRNFFQQIFSNFSLEM